MTSHGKCVCRQYYSMNNRLITVCSCYLPSPRKPNKRSYDDNRGHLWSWKYSAFYLWCWIPDQWIKFHNLSAQWILGFKPTNVHRYHIHLKWTHQEFSKFNLPGCQIIRMIDFVVLFLVSVLRFCEPKIKLLTIMYIFWQPEKFDRLLNRISKYLWWQKENFLGKPSCLLLLY